MEIKKMNVHAGHNPDGKIACGAVGLIKESTENRKVKNEVIKLLEKHDIEVYDCTFDNGKSKADQLQGIVVKCNKHGVDIDLSIHFNSSAKDKKGNGKTTGVEVLVYSFNNTEIVKVAKRICESVSDLGFKNRGVKERPELYVLRKTDSKAMLIECCFVDDKDDVDLYKKVGAKGMATAIVEGIIGKKLEDKKPKEEKPKKETSSKKEEPKKETSSNLPSLKGYKGQSIVDGLKKFGYKSSFKYRETLWEKAGKTTKYRGTASQNLELLKILKKS